MLISIKGFITQKMAEQPEDCQDRYGINTNTNKFAICDGVTKSFFSAIWAELLIDSYLKDSVGAEYKAIKSTAALMQVQWYKKVKAIAEKPDQKWFVKNAFILGKPACATFVGLHFHKARTGLFWQAVVIGDSCLFFVPAEMKYVSLDSMSKVRKLSSNDGFDNFPDYLCSRGELLKGSVKECQELLRAGTFYLMTDALAEWLICKGQDAIEIISSWKNQSDFEKSVAALRKGDLKNDDVSILIIRVDEDDSSQIHYGKVELTDINKL